MIKKILLLLLVLFPASVVTFFIWRSVKYAHDPDPNTTFLIPRMEIFPIKAKDIAYEFAIENNEWIKGIIPDTTEIMERSVTELTIPVRISFKEVSKTLFDLLKKGMDVKYKLHLTLKTITEKNFTNDSKVILQSSGSVKSLMKVVKK